MVYTSICKNCGKEYRAKTRRSMFCSEQCRREADKERKREKYGAIREERVCPECGRTFETKRSTSNFCSRACSVKFAEKRKGNKDKFEQLTKGKISIKELFLREKGTCYLCGEKCDFEDVILIDEFLAAGQTFPVIDYITSEDGKNRSAKLAHHCCKKQKEEKKNVSGH